MSDTINDYKGNVVINLPQSTGFASDASIHSQVLANLEQNVIDSKSKFLLSQINERVNAINKTSETILKSQEIVNLTQKILNDMNSIDKLDYDSMSLNLSDLIISKLNSNKLLIDANNTINSHIGLINNDLVQKDMELVDSIQKQVSSSNERDAKISSIQSQINTRNLTLQSIYETLTRDVNIITQAINDTLGNTSIEIKSVRFANNYTMFNQTNFLKKIFDDLFYQTNNSGPEYLSSLEIEKMTSALKSLNSINETIKAINSEVQSMFGSSSFNNYTNSGNGSSSFLHSSTSSSNIRQNSLSSSSSSIRNRVYGNNEQEPPSQEQEEDEKNEKLKKEVNNQKLEIDDLKRKIELILKKLQIN
jgi:hypothetical protein